MIGNRSELPIGGPLGFSRTFRGKVGVSPELFRQRHRQENVPREDHHASRQDR